MPRVLRFFTVLVLLWSSLAATVLWTEHPAADQERVKIGRSGLDIL